MSDRERVSELARKAAMLENCTMAVFKRTDGTYGFAPDGSEEINGDIVEYRTNI